MIPPSRQKNKLQEGSATSAATLRKGIIPNQRDDEKNNKL
jgi:hypothetical protein